jgi:hypothetical protein
MSHFGVTPLNAGSGGPSLATSTFSYDVGGDHALMPWSALTYLASGNPDDNTGVFQTVDASHGLPVNLLSSVPIALAAGSAVIGHMVVDSVGGTVAITAASLPLPTGAATSAKQPALGTAGTASADVISVQGIAGMMAVKVDGSGVIQPVSIAGDQAVNVAQVNGTAASVNTGNADNGTQRVVLASNQPAVNVTETNLDGSIVAWAGTTAPGKGLGILGKTNDGTPQYQPVPMGPSGRTVIVEGYAGGVEVPTNETKVGGNAIAVGNGTTSTGTQRVTISSDSTGQVTLAAGAATIGALTAHQSTNVDQLNGTTVDTNSGNKSAGTLRVVLATDQPQLTNTLKVDPSGVISPVSIAGNQAVNLAQVAGTTTSVNAGACDAGTTRVAIGTDDSITVDSRWSSADTNLHTVKASAGHLFKIEITNNGAGAVYLKIYNKASNPVLASDTPWKRFIIPGNTAGAGGVFDYGPLGRSLSTGIAYSITGAAGDTDTTAIAANQCAINVDYK